MRQLEQAFDGTTFFITHHLPALKSIAPRYAHDPLKLAFASRLESVIKRHQPALLTNSRSYMIRVTMSREVDRESAAGPALNLIVVV